MVFEKKARGGRGVAEEYDGAEDRERSREGKEYYV